MGAWLAIGLAAAVAAVVIGKSLATKSALRGRTPEPLETLYGPVRDQVSFEIFSEVLSVLGRVYSIDPRLLRPTDTFAALGKIDSWTLGQAEDQVGKWLKEKGVEAPPRLQTVLDLARCVQSSPATNAAR